MRLRGPLDRPAIESSLRELILRHEALRATFSPDGLSLLIATEAPHELRVLDFTALDSAARSAALAELFEREVCEPFELEHGPLYRCRLVRLAPEEHVIVFTAHHIVCDGWSTGVLIQEWSKLYSSQVKGGPVAIGDAERFSDYARAAAEDSEERREAEDYWVERFQDGAPMLDLPLDRPRPPLKTYRSLREDYVLDRELTAGLKQAAARAGASLFGTLLGGFQALLHRITGQDDIVVGIAAAGQSTGHERLVGHCVNTLPIRARIDPSAPAGRLLKAIGSTVLDAFEHQALTLGSLLRLLTLPRDPSRLPLVSVVFNLDTGLGDFDFAGLEATFAVVPRRYENFDLFVNAVEVEGTIALECQYNTDLFDSESVRRWLVGYETLLRGVASDSSTPVCQLPVLSRRELEAFEKWNATQGDYPRQRAVHDLFCEQAAKTPNAVAVAHDGSSITYGELDRRSNRLARTLAARGVREGSLVGLCVRRSIDMLVGLLGILKTGGAYVPLDPDYPADRLSFMVQDSGMTLLVAQESTRQVVAGAPAVSVFCLDGAPEAWASDDAPLRSSRVTGESPAYVIYTSGSTGRPKGVLVPHRSVVNLLASVARTPGMDSRDVVLAITTLSFDIAVSELILPLVVGARIVLAGRELAGDGDRLRDAISAHGVTFLDATPASWRLLLAAGWTGSSGLKAICTGEAMPPDLAEQLVDRTGSLWNGYGPTETTVWSTFHPIRRPLGRILIGRPIANTQVHVLDGSQQRVPVGVSGELYIGGDGVTLGYLNRPELTRERFVADPFRPGQLMYRTGDIGRWLPDGTLECLGRNDSQVKVRGFRIELGEIEAVLAQHPEVRQAVVVARPGLAAGDVRLIAYYVDRTKGRLSDSALREHLGRALPEYMVPQVFVPLATFPLTPSGKVDRKALPDPGNQRSEQEHVAPRTDAERLIARIWQETLGIARVGATDNVFHLGAHSLLAAQVATRLSREWGRTVLMRSVFQHPTVAALGAFLDAEVGKAPTTSIPRRADRTRAPLSLMQQRLWFLEQMDPGRSTHNVPSAHRLRGALDLAAFRRAFDELVRRQDSLRTILRMTQDVPEQLVLPHTPVALTLEDLSSVAPAGREAALKRRLEAETAATFDLESGPLYRSILFRLREDEHVLFFMAHHLVFDGWSFDLLYNELSKLYAAFRHGEGSPLGELPVAYGDFAEWHREWLRGEELERQVSHWKQRLDGALEPLELPADRPRPPVFSGRGGSAWLRISSDRTAALGQVARRADATLFMALLSAFSVLIARHSKRREVVIGTPVRGRALPELNDVIGFFVNALPMRLSVDPEESFLALLARTRQTVLEAFEHEDVPLERLVQELHPPVDLSRSPLYQVMFSFQDVRGRPTTWGNLGHSRVEVSAPHVAQDLGLWFVQDGTELGGALTYATDLFDAATVQRMVDHLQLLLSKVCAFPETPLSELELLPEAERQQLVSWNPASSEYPRQLLAHELVSEQAGRSPEASAIEFAEESITYRQLERRSNQLARRLRKLGVGRGLPVGVCLERTPEMVIAVQAILRAGAAYVPLDPEHPAERLSLIARDSGIRLLVTESAVQDAVPGVETLLLLDQEAEALACESEAPLGRDEHSATPDDAAYVIYTSGSTGVPKGVEVPHRALVNFLTSMAARARCARRGPRARGHDPVVRHRRARAAPAAHRRRHGPAARSRRGDGRCGSGERARAQEADRHAGDPGHLAPAARGGLAGRPAAAHPLRRRAAAARPRRRAARPRRRAVEHVRSHRDHDLVDLSPRDSSREPDLHRTTDRQHAGVRRRREGQAVSDRRPGRAVDRRRWRGPGLPQSARAHGGALRRGPVRARAGGLYRTGDLARWCADGTLEHLGRLDQQVKVRGFRIELGEIEAALARHSSVSQAVVAARQLRPGDVRLVAYVVSAPGQQLASGALRKSLRGTLPEYMIPSHFVSLEALPLTPSGKVDRKRLPAVVEAPTTNEPLAEPRTESEKLLTQIWRECLVTEQVGLHDNFFDLGGHSLLTMKVIHEVRTRTGVRLSPQVFLTQSLEQIAAGLNAEGRG